MCSKDLCPLLKGDEPLLVQGTAEVEENSARSSQRNRLPEEGERRPSRAWKFVSGGVSEQGKARGNQGCPFKYPGDSSVLLRVELAQGEPVIIPARSK